MAIGPRLDLRQSQNLVMTPQLQQAIKLLQLSSVELNAFVEEELERNPLLERDEGSPDPAGIEDPDRHAEAVIDQYSGDSADMMAGDTAPGLRDDPLDMDSGNVFDTDIAGPGAEGLGTEGVGAEAYDSGIGAESYAGLGGNRQGFDGDEGYEAVLGAEETLQDHLIAQIGTDISNDAERLIAVNLVHSLDQNGWLTTPVAEIAEQLGAEEALVESVLERLRRLDPPGVFARDLKECLALQLIERDRYDPAMRALIENLELLARREWDKLKRICDIDGEDLGDMIAEIKALSPRPAEEFSTVVAEPVVPDVLLFAAPDGEWRVELNPESLPKVLVNERFYAQISRRKVEKEEKNYLVERFQTANWLVKSLQQRATTILKVASEIVRQQDGFFRHGVGHLKPLILRDIAEAIEMHESTVSRVTSNKFIASPRGLFELKYFFTTAIAGTAGETHSAETVRHRIRALIDQETAKTVLSDDKLVELLGAEGIEIARRTVAKYREAMKIPSSVQRRREKKSLL